MFKYKVLGKLGEGAFSEVFKAKEKRSNKLVAIKKLKSTFESAEQANRLREVEALNRLNPHPNIIRLIEVLFDRATGEVAMVFELMEMNMYDVIRASTERRVYLPEEKVLHYAYQLVKAVDHMHKQRIFHRDIKPENVLVVGDALKLADLGSCRGIYTQAPFTEYIATRWYRAPECLLTSGYYNYKMDMWSVGCVLFEIMSLYPLFPGSNELDMVHRIHAVLGTPSAEYLAQLKAHAVEMDFNFPPRKGTGLASLLPHVSPDALDLLTKLLAYDPEDRCSAKHALRHPYFKEIRELDKQLQKASRPHGPTLSGTIERLEGTVDTTGTNGSMMTTETPDVGEATTTLPTVGNGGKQPLVSSEPLASTIVTETVASPPKSKELCPEADDDAPPTEAPMDPIKIKQLGSTTGSKKLLEPSVPQLPTLPVLQVKTKVPLHAVPKAGVNGGKAGPSSTLPKLPGR